jgi:hypothetical protein
MTTTEATGLKPGDCVQSLGKSRCTMFVHRDSRPGRLVLEKHGHPTIRNANPKRWRVVARKGVR